MLPHAYKYSLQPVTDMAERKAKALDIFELLSSCPWSASARERGQERIRSYEVLGFERVPLLPLQGRVGQA